jgi:hypothetical protein
MFTENHTSPVDIPGMLPYSLDFGHWNLQLQPLAFISIKLASAGDTSAHVHHTSSLLEH